uniref:Uncharacterized protein n=1 Tax=Oryzias latipes TaxID=8090 RepID=A0A3P9M046_ORYLA
FAGVAGGNDFQWCFSQVKGAIDEDVAEGQSTCLPSLPLHPRKPNSGLIDGKALGRGPTLERC